jgi:hypothetical protein
METPTRHLLDSLIKNVPVVFYIRVTPDIYHGTQVITNIRGSCGVYRD